MNYVAAGDTTLVTFGLVRKWSEARVGEEDVVPGQVRLRDDVVCLVQQVVDLRIVGDYVIEIALVAGVRRADQVPAVPGDDEVRSAIFPRLDVERRLGRSGEGINYQVASLGPPDHTLLRIPVAIHPAEHLVYPGASHVDGDGGVRCILLATQSVFELDAHDVAVLDNKATYLGVGEHDGAVLASRDGVLDSDALSIL